MTGVSTATSAEADSVIIGEIVIAPITTVISCSAYPVVYYFTVFGIRMSNGFRPSQRDWRQMATTEKPWEK